MLRLFFPRDITFDNDVETWQKYAIEAINNASGSLSRNSSNYRKTERGERALHQMVEKKRKGKDNFFVFCLVNTRDYCSNRTILFAIVWPVYLRKGFCGPSESVISHIDPFFAFCPIIARVKMLVRAVYANVISPVREFFDLVYSEFFSRHRLSFIIIIWRISLFLISPIMREQILFVTFS